MSWESQLEQTKHLDTRSEHSRDCHKICALCAERWEKAESCQCVPGPSGQTHSSCQRSSQVTELGSMGTTIKKSNDFLLELPSSLHPKNAKQEKSLFQCEVCADTFCTCWLLFSETHRIVCHTFILQAATVNQHFYKDILSCLRDDMWQQQPDHWHTGHSFSSVTITLLAPLCLCRNSEQ
jgi:hypothetical protein